MIPATSQFRGLIAAVLTPMTARVGRSVIRHGCDLMVGNGSVPDALRLALLCARSQRSYANPLSRDPRLIAHILSAVLRLPWRTALTLSSAIELCTVRVLQRPEDQVSQCLDRVEHI